MRPPNTNSPGVVVFGYTRLRLLGGAHGLAELQGKLEGAGGFSFAVLLEGCQEGLPGTRVAECFVDLQSILRVIVPWAACKLAVVLQHPQHAGQSLVVQLVVGGPADTSTGAGAFAAVSLAGIAACSTGRPQSGCRNNAGVL